MDAKEEKKLFREYMGKDAPNNLKELFNDLDEDDGIMLEICFNKYAESYSDQVIAERMPSVERSRLTTFGNWLKKRLVWHLVLDQYDNYVKQYLKSQQPSQPKEEQGEKAGEENAVPCDDLHITYGHNNLHT